MSSQIRARAWACESVLMLEGQRGLCCRAWDSLCLISRNSSTPTFLYLPLSCVPSTTWHGTAVICHLQQDSCHCVHSALCLWVITVETALVVLNATHGVICCLDTHTCWGCPACWHGLWTSCSASTTQQRAVILLHRYFTVNSSTECMKLSKWVSTTSCVQFCLGRPAWMRLCRHALGEQLFVLVMLVHLSAHSGQHCRFGGFCRPVVQTKVFSTVLLPVAISSCKICCCAFMCRALLLPHKSWGPAVDSLLLFPRICCPAFCLPSTGARNRVCVPGQQDRQRVPQAREHRAHSHL